MSENINFIPAAELPLAEGMNVETLCIENGELKRSAGGAGGGYTIHVSPDEFSMEDESTEINIMISESRDNFGPILEAGGTVWLDLSSTVISAVMGNGGLLRVMISAWVFTEGTLMLAASMGGLTLTAISMNGTWAPSEG